MLDYIIYFKSKHHFAGVSMAESTQAIIERILEDDPRFHQNAYYFMLKCLNYSVQKHESQFKEDDSGQQKHVSGPQLLECIREIALRDFGYMARIVFEIWGIKESGNWGTIVFNLIDSQLLSKSDSDSRSDFNDVYDFEEALDKAFFKEKIYKLRNEYR